MEKYDYLKVVMDDVRNFIETSEIVITSSNVEEMREYLNEECWEDDSVTGGMSGVYTSSIWEAEENLCHNWGLLEDAMEGFGLDLNDAIKKGAEWCDMNIRQYLLTEAIDKVLDSMEIKEDEDEEE